MTVEATVRRAGPTQGNGAATVFPFAFKVFESTDLLVQLTVISTGVITDLVLDAVDGYTVSLNPDQDANPGGDVTYNPSGVPMPATKTLTITSVMPKDQETHIINGGAFLANNVEQMVDRAIIAIQDLAVKVDASLQFPAVDGSLTTVLPAAAQRANMLLAFDADGNLIVTAGGADVPVSIAMQPVVQAATLAIARDEMGFDGAQGVIATGDIADLAVTEGKLANNAVAYTKLSAAVQAALLGMVGLLHVDADTGHRDMIASGWMPAFFNQQWGGAPHYFEMTDGATGVPYRFEAATGGIDQDSRTGVSAEIVGYDATSAVVSQGFKVSASQSVSAVWAKVDKVGNPADNLQLRIQADDGTGKPTANFTAITNGTATAQSGKLHASGDESGQWIRFVFPTPCALVAGTQYHITFQRSGAVDVANCWVVLSGNAGKYPHGVLCRGTAVPVWTAQAATDMCFLVEAATTAVSLQSGGIFSDGKLQFFEGSPLNQSNARVKNLRDFAGLDLTDCTLLVRGTAWTKDRTILDIQYGLDHDRIVLRSNTATGFAQVDVYESDGTKHTITATSVDLSAGDHDVAIRIRAKNDGADAISLYVDGAANGAPLGSQSISFNTLFGAAQIGTAWLGGGFVVAPAWTKDTAMGTLPSADGWTWTGTGTEANCMSVSGGKLYQNKSGYGAQTGYYSKTALGFANATGLSAAFKMRTVSDPNTKAVGTSIVQVADGTRGSYFFFKEYFVEMYDGTALDRFITQYDQKSVENVLHVTTKLADAMLFVNGRLMIDGTGAFTTANANNLVDFGDATATANENSDNVWDYVKYYNTAALLPQFTSGSLSEFAIWNGDKTAILAALYNAGAFISAKQFCGAQKNYVGDEVVQRTFVAGVTSAPTTTSTVGVVAAELEAFSIGSVISGFGQINVFNSGANNDWVVPCVDGRQLSNSSVAPNDIGGGSGMTGTANQALTVSIAPSKRYFGLHRSEMRVFTAAGTLSMVGVVRNMTVETRQ